MKQEKHINSFELKQLSGTPGNENTLQMSFTDAMDYLRSIQTVIIDTVENDKTIAWIFRYKTITYFDIGSIEAYELCIQKFAEEVKKHEEIKYAKN